MGYPTEDKLVIGVSGRALFNLGEAHRVFIEQGLAAYKKYQREHEDDPLDPGTGFSLVKGLLSINEKVADRAVEVVVISRNDGDSGLRIMNSIAKHGLDISRASFCGGRNADGYFSAYNCKLFLSAEESDVVKVIGNGGAAALVLPPPENYEHDSSEVRIAFDADAVLFSDEAEKIYQQQGILMFHQTEAANAKVPLSAGPFKPFIQALATLKSKFPPELSPIRTAVVTARNAPAHERAILTLRTWGISVDEMHFLGGIDKRGVLDVFKPNIFFDDQTTHLQSCAEKMPAAQVPYGIAAVKKPVAAALPKNNANVRPHRNSSNRHK